MTAQLRQRAIELVDQLPQEMLSEVVGILESLRLKAEGSKEQASSTNEERESALLEIVRRRPFGYAQDMLPASDRKRLDYLRASNEAETITEDEHEKLLAYVERVERQDVERLKALIKLAEIREVDLDKQPNEGG